MPPKRDLNPSGLGRAIINRKVKDARRQQESGMYVTDLDSTSRLQSITQERDLDEFLNTAQLAGTEFTAERRNVKIIQQSAEVSYNPYLLSQEEEKQTLKKHQENKQRLRVPRRPPWTKTMTTAELERQEKTAFLEWRRGLAELQEQEKFLLTPFERNLEVWRQLWRVLERSHLIVQIVDARNPLRFRCEDLEDYVKDVEGPEGEQGTGKNKRRSLLLINKSDLLTLHQRTEWANYFDSQNIQYAFFSAANATALQEARRAVLEETRSDSGEDDSGDDVPSSEDEDEPNTPDDTEGPSDSSFNPEDGSVISAEGKEHTEDEDQLNDPRVSVLSVLQLEELFQTAAPPLTDFTDTNGTPPSKLVVGLVGYPNVGKSSTINSLIGEKKVSVSATPGKTKHFQTINLSDSITLCDCPGLVFPQFATTKAELVCDGVLPIDQMREYSGPISLVVGRIPRAVLEATYGLSIKTKPLEEGGTGTITSESFLIAHAIARGFMRSGQGNPDEARSARYILKDYVNAKLLYGHPPPGLSSEEFNKGTHDNALKLVEGKKRAPVTRVGKGADTFIPANAAGTLNKPAVPMQGQKSLNLDDAFFEERSTAVGRAFTVAGKEITRSTVFPHQNSVMNDGTTLTPSHARLASVLSSQDGVFTNGKKHKKMKRGKQRSGKGYD